MRRVEKDDLLSDAHLVKSVRHSFSDAPIDREVECWAFDIPALYRRAAIFEDGRPAASLVRFRHDERALAEAVAEYRQQGDCRVVGTAVVRFTTCECEPQRDARGFRLWHAPCVRPATVLRKSFVDADDFSQMALEAAEAASRARAATDAVKLQVCAAHSTYAHNRLSECILPCAAAPADRDAGGAEGHLREDARGAPCGER